MVGTIVRFVTARIEYVECTLAGGMDPSSDAFLTLSKGACTAINDQLMHLRVLAVEESTTLMKILLESFLAEADKKYLVDMLTKRTDLTSQNSLWHKKERGPTMQRLVCKKTMREER